MALERIARPRGAPYSVLMNSGWKSPKPHRGFPELGSNEPAQIRSVVPDPHAIKRILLLKLDHRGDFIMATEAFKTFRDIFEQAEITIVCGPWNAEEAETSGYLDRIVPFAFFSEDDSAQAVRPPRDELIAGFARQIEGERMILRSTFASLTTRGPVLKRLRPAIGRASTAMIRSPGSPSD